MGKVLSIEERLRKKKIAREYKYNNNHNAVLDPIATVNKINEIEKDLIDLAVILDNHKKAILMLDDRLIKLETEMGKSNSRIIKLVRALKESIVGFTIK